VSRRRVVWLLAGSVVLVGALFLFALPARTYLGQRQSLDAAEVRVRVLSAENARLTQEQQRLQTDAEIERIAREQYGLVKPGEQAYAILPPKAATPTIPPPSPPDTARHPHHHPWWAFWR
jgi:cell division protein FtsB